MVVWGTIVIVGAIMLAALTVGVVVYCAYKLVDKALRKCGF